MDGEKWILGLSLQKNVGASPGWVRKREKDRQFSESMK